MWFHFTGLVGKGSERNASCLPWLPEQGVGATAEGEAGVGSHASAQVLPSLVGPLCSILQFPLLFLRSHVGCQERCAAWAAGARAPRACPIHQTHYPCSFPSSPVPTSLRCPSARQTFALVAEKQPCCHQMLRPQGALAVDSLSAGCH